MPQRLHKWRERLAIVIGEHRSARVAVDRLKLGAIAVPPQIPRDDPACKYLRQADENLEGTYLVRLFASFEAALRSYDRTTHNDPARETKAGTMIDEIAGKRGRRIALSIRVDAHEVRELRNYWAHEQDEMPKQIPIEEARARLETYLNELPQSWG